MTKKNDIPTKAEAHIRYRNSENQIVPGVSTPLGLLNKPQLVKWANNLGLQGINSEEYSRDKAEIGGLAHHLVKCHLKGETPCLDDYTLEQIRQARFALRHYRKWSKGKVIEPILIEFPLVSELHQFGGTPDFYGDVDGVRCIVDYKTGGIYREATIQTCAYAELIESCGYDAPKKIIILGIPRDSTENFREVTITEFEHGKLAFIALLVLYRELKYIK